MKGKITALILIFALLLGLAVPALAVTDNELDAAVNGTAAYLCRTIKEPATGAVGGEWAVLGLARCGYNVPKSWYDAYYESAVQFAKEKEGVLHARKYTDFSRTIIGLAAIGKDARDVAGYDLTRPLGDFDKTVWQGINGPVWALIALDTLGYPVAENPEAKTQAARQMYIDEILARQLDDGGWNLSAKGGSALSDADITGMTLQALAPYQGQPAVAKAVAEAVDCMSKRQDGKGGFSTMITTGTEQTATSESCAQMVVGLCALGIDPDADPRFVKNGNSLLGCLLSYRDKSGGFEHIKGYGVDGLATEQGFYAIVAAQRLRQGKTGLYDMSDTEFYIGLPNRHADVNVKPVVTRVTFPDVQGVDCQTAVEALAARKIISGMGDGLFAPESTMTRAQFAAITVQGLGIAAVTPDKPSFSDVATEAWYYALVETASRYGIITGYPDGTFDPGGTLTRTEAAVMVARAAKLCGLDTDMDAGAVGDVLARFGDHTSIAAWAQPGVAFCYASGIWDGSVSAINGGALIPRKDVAQMMYDLLTLAKLI